MDYKKISQDVVDHVGGISNIKGATHCVTRLRLILNDETKYDRKALENIEGVKGVLFNSGQLMIIFGTGTVNNVYDAFIELTGVKNIESFDSLEFLIETSLGFLNITGSELSLTRLDQEKSEVSIKGNIDSISYVSNKKGPKSKESVFNKLLK